MLGIEIGIAILFICFNLGRCGYCDQHTIPFQGVVKNSTRFYLTGESFAVTCESGYRVAVADIKFTCRNGYWSGHFPPCIPNDCSTPPPAVEHARIKSYTGKHFSTVEYECDEHYLPRTDYRVQCDHGLWTGRKPICMDSRCYTRDLKLKDGLSSTPNTTHSGARLDVKCETGYYFHGMKPLCVRGSWTEYGASPCKEHNCTTVSVSNGALVEPKEKRVWRWDSFKRERTDVFKKVTPYQQRVPGTVLYVSCDKKNSFNRYKVSKTICSKAVWVPEPKCE